MSLDPRRQSFYRHFRKKIKFHPFLSTSYLYISLNQNIINSCTSPAARQLTKCFISSVFLQNTLIKLLLPNCVLRVSFDSVMIMKLTINYKCTISLYIVSCVSLFPLSLDTDSTMGDVSAKSGIASLNLLRMGPIICTETKLLLFAA